MVYRRNRNKQVPKKLKQNILKVIKQHEKKVVEVKFCDTAFTTAFPANAYGYQGAVVALTYPIQGTGVQERIADTILVKQIFIRMNQVAFPASSVAGRVIVFVWHEDNNISVPTMTDIMDSTGSYVSTNLAPFFMLKPAGSNERAKYTILYDKTYNAPYYGGTKGYIEFTIDKKMNLKTTFDENLQVGTNIIYVFYISDLVYSSQPQLKVISRISYTDQ